MADRRVTDLSYGHPGLASYDPKTKKWRFSTSFEEVLSVEQIEPFKEFVPPSIENAQIEKDTASKTTQNQVRMLLKDFPELHPSKKLISSLVATELSETQPTSSGTLLAIGYALDIDGVSGNLTIPVFVMASGIAAHVLQISQLATETRGWGKTGKDRLDLLTNSSTETGYWRNNSGTIRQITFSDTDKESSTWLAVRQDSVVTIFLPILSEKSYHPTSVNISREFLAPSHLNVNPVASVSIGNSVSLSHSDLSFNPWLPRQFATIDSSGCWTIYNIERSCQGPSYEEISKKSAGSISDGHDFMHPLRSTSSSLADEWHRIMWIGNVNTIVVCNRFHLAIFHLSPKPIRLKSPVIISNDSTDWILDIVRFPSNKTQFFVLTTSRIYWIQVISSFEQSENEEDPLGGSVILSYRHFRSPYDESLKLVPVMSGKISILLTSTKQQLISAFFFSESIGTFCSQYFLQTSFTPMNKTENRNFVLSACLMPCRLSLLSEKGDSRPEFQYLRNGVQFYQLWMLTPTLQLLSTLLAARSYYPNKDMYSDLRDIAPVEKIVASPIFRSRRVTEEPFIISDEAMFDEPIVTCLYRSHTNKQCLTEVTNSDDLRLRLDWRRVYQQIFPCSLREENINSAIINPEIKNTKDFLSITANLIHERCENENASLTSIYEICNFHPIFVDLREFEEDTENFLRHLSVQKADSTLKNLLVSRDIAVSTGIGLSLEIGKAPSLAYIFNQLLDYWISPLSKQISQHFREARIKMIRKLAIDLYLSSIGILVKVNNNSFLDSLPETEGSFIFPTDMNAALGSSGLESSQTSTNKEQKRTDVHNSSSSGLSSSCSSPIPSLKSLDEDPAISYLRQYAISIQSKSNIREPAFLKSWPSTPRSVPDLNYFNKVIMKSAVDVKDDVEKKFDTLTEQPEILWRKKKNLSRSQSINASLSQNSQSQQSQKIITDIGEAALGKAPSTNPNSSILRSKVVEKSKKIRKQRTAGF